MATATLIQDNGNQRIYRNSKGSIIFLEINDEWSEITFRVANKKFGEFIFKDLEDGTYKLMRMYTEPHNNTGLGRAALEMFCDVTGCEIYVSPNDGMTRDDQSHWTQDAPKFLPKMINLGLIQGISDERDINDGFF